jgi:hypothetical protein
MCKKDELAIFLVYSRIVCHAARILSEKGHKLDGVVLEAAILNAREAFKEFTIMQVICRRNKKVSSLIDDLLNEAGICFENSKNILEINSKILLIHSKTDVWVTYRQGEALFEASKARAAHLPPVKFATIETNCVRAYLGLSHFLQSQKQIYPLIK